MPNPIRNWTEDDVLALPAGENDSFERKGSRLLDLKLSGVKEDDVLNELAKQLSAFSNTGGGQIIYESQTMARWMVEASRCPSKADSLQRNG